MRESSRKCDSQSLSQALIALTLIRKNQMGRFYNNRNLADYVYVDYVQSWGNSSTLLEANVTSFDLESPLTIPFNQYRVMTERFTQLGPGRRSPDENNENSSIRCSTGKNFLIRCRRHERYAEGKCNCEDRRNNEMLIPRRKKRHQDHGHDE